MDSIVVAIWICLALVTMAVVLQHFTIRNFNSRLSGVFRRLNALENHVQVNCLNCHLFEQILDYLEDLENDDQNELPFNDGDQEP